MTEKRFELIMNGNEVAQYEIIDRNQEILTVYNNLGNVYFSSAMKICELLNDLNDENEQLNKKLRIYKSDGLETLNDLQRCYENSKKAMKTIDALYEENEQLKSTIKEVTELLSDEVDLFSEKATEHDINAYVELKELDNKDAYYMATATKKAIRMLKELQE